MATAQSSCSLLFVAISWRLLHVRAASSTVRSSEQAVEGLERVPRVARLDWGQQPLVCTADALISAGDPQSSKPHRAA